MTEQAIEIPTLKSNRGQLETIRRARAARPRIVEDDDRWAAQIRTAWQKSVEGILETGSLLIQAKADLPHGRFEIMVRNLLPFSGQTARKLMAISRNPVISERAHVRVLPPSWGTLYELSKLDQEQLGFAIGNHLIKPETQRKDLPRIFYKVRKAFGLRAKKPAPETQARLSFWKSTKRDLGSEVIAKLDAMSDSDRGRVVSAILAAMEAAK